MSAFDWETELIQTSQTRLKRQLGAIPAERQSCAHASTQTKTPWTLLQLIKLIPHSTLGLSLSITVTLSLEMHTKEMIRVTYFRGLKEKKNPNKNSGAVSKPPLQKPRNV